MNFQIASICRLPIPKEAEEEELTIEMGDDEFEDMLVLVNKERKNYTSEQLQKEAEMIERFSEDYDADLVKIAFCNFDDRDAVNEESMAEMLEEMFEFD